MSKQKKISITTFDNVMKATYSPAETINWHGEEVIIKRNLSLRDVLTFVDGVTKACFTEETGAYIPEVKDFIIKCYVLEMYANFTLPQNLEHKYELVYCTDAVSIVLQHINSEQFAEVLNAINDKIDNIAQSNIEAINKRMNEVYAAFANLQSQLEGMFSGFNPEDIPNLINALSNGALSEERLVQAYMNATESSTPTKDGE